MMATGATPADQARSLGLVVGDTIEADKFQRLERLMLLWIGDEVAVWMRSVKSSGVGWENFGETADWLLGSWDWVKVEVQR